MAYTVVITSAAGSYTFQVTPNWRPSFAYEYDETRTPPRVRAEIETWVLENAVFVHATQANITSDLESLRAVLVDAAGLTSVAFKRDSTTVRELTTATHTGGIQIRALEAGKGEAGQWATHWSGDLVVYGRRLITTSDIVDQQQELSYTYDAAGLATVTKRGTVSTVPGTSAETKAREQALDSPGAAYGLETQGPDDEPSVSTNITDTKATYESTWREHGVSLPAGVNDYTLASETQETPEGNVVTTTVRARGPTSSSLRTAVRGQRPSSALSSVKESEDETRIEWSASYVQRQVNDTTRSRTGSSKIFYRRVEYDVQGQDEDDSRDVNVDLIPGYGPFFTENPIGAKTITERIVSRIRGTFESAVDFNLDPRGGELTGTRLQPSRSRRHGPVLEEAGLTTDADVWRAEATYVYLASSVDFERVAALAKDQ